MEGSSNPPARLSVGVIGAGIAGLASAIALRRAGHDVDLFERSQFKSEIGAAITITPNGTLVLKHWGINSDTLAVKSEGITAAHHQSLQIFFQDTFDGVQERFGNAIYHWHRIQLHRSLKLCATSATAHPSRPAVIHLGQQILDIDCDQGLIFLNDSRTIQKDLLIIADGHKSNFNHHFNPASTHIPLRKYGRSSFRTLVPFSAMNAHSDLQKLYSSVPVGFYMPINVPSLTYLVTYPCRTEADELMLNIAIVHNTRPEDADKDDWHSTTTADSVISVLDGFAPAFHDLIRLAPEITVYTLGTRDLLPSFSSGRAVILGDAAAQMQPQHTQGGTVALESAAALEILFFNLDISSASEKEALVAERARDFDSLMRKHIQVVQLFSDATPLSADDPARRQAEELLRDEGRILPSPMAVQFSEEVREFLHGYNVLEETKAYLEKKNANKPE